MKMEYSYLQINAIQSQVYILNNNKISLLLNVQNSYLFIYYYMHLSL